MSENTQPVETPVETLVQPEPPREAAVVTDAQPERIPADRPRAKVIGGTFNLDSEEPKQDNQVKLLQQLRGLWKGTLYTTIYTLYTALIGWLLVWIDWRAALLAFFAISVSHPLRYIVNSVDKIGWEMGDQQDKHGVRAYQQRLFWGLYSVITLCNLFLVAQAYFVSSTWPAVAVFVSLGVVEFLFHQIRTLNRKIEYAYADYGRS